MCSVLRGFKEKFNTTCNFELHFATTLKEFNNEIITISPLITVVAYNDVQFASSTVDHDQTSCTIECADGGTIKSNYTPTLH